MEKMKMESANLTDMNIEKIAELFPNCITETADENGKLKKAVNFEMLRAMLSEDIAEGDEAYEFTWVGKKAAIAEANRPIRKTLRPCPEESVNWDTTENLYIEGDNLEVLKLLQESYLGKVKMIYIDPPYNTGNDFIYRDDFAMSADDYAEESGQLDEDGNRLFKNTDSNGRFHSDWCSMIYSRLMLARNLLADDGVIFISIDDNEVENLKKVCNEVFGERNFISDFIWNSRKSVSNDAVVSLNHNYTLLYTKSIVAFNEIKKTFKLKDNGEGFENPDNDPRGKWKADPFDSPGIRPNLTYPITNPNTGETFMPPNGRCWRTGEKEYKQFLADNRIVFGKTGKGKPQLKRFYSEAEEKGLTPKSLWDDCGTATEGTNEVMKLFSSKVFDTPKPTSLIRKMLELSTFDDSIILDFFSGSATTAHAVMAQNFQDVYDGKLGKRKFIMVQLPEPCDEKSEAYKAGYKNICEIGKERIRRAGKQEYMSVCATMGSSLRWDSEKRGKDPNYPCPESVDIGFRVLKLDDTNMQDVYYTPAETDQQMLLGFESNIKPDRTDLDLLFGCLLDWGLPLSMPYSSEQIDGVTVHTYNDGDLIACFDKAIPESVIKTIAKRQPLRVVFRDDSFADSPSKINVSEIFKMLSSDTRVKVI